MRKWCDDVLCACLCIYEYMYLASAQDNNLDNVPPSAPPLLIGMPVEADAMYLTETLARLLQSYNKYEPEGLRSVPWHS